MEHLKSIYQNFDIRGEYNTELTEAETTKIARALTVLYQAKKVVIGYDYRPSSESLHAALLDGFLLQGADVISLGLLTTPMLYHGAGVHNADVSVMISGSHMAPRFNGLKICVQNVTPIGLDSGLAAVRDLVHASDFPTVDTPGSVEQQSIEKSWRARCQSLVALGAGAPTKVVVDPANMIGILELNTLRQFPELAVTSIYDTYDWSVPHHEANPVKLETMDDLGARVVQDGAAIGIALDGDADRIGIVDEKGQPVPQDVVGALLAEELIARNGGSGTVLYDVRSSKFVAEVVERAGGRAIPWRIGHTYLRRKMPETGAIFALELSGHHFFKEMYNSEGGIYPALLLIEIMRQRALPLSELARAYRPYFHSSEINSSIRSTPDEIYQTLRAEFPDAEFDTIDGLTIKYDTWWCNVRPSANDPVMRLNLEANDQATMTVYRDRVLELIRA